MENATTSLSTTDDFLIDNSHADTHSLAPHWPVSFDESKATRGQAQSLKAGAQRERHQMLLSLNATIDLHKLCGIFFKHLQDKLSLVSLKIQFSGGALTIGESVDSGHFIDMSIGDNMADLRYGFESTPANTSPLSLSDMHQMFVQPLRNALEHHFLKQVAMKDYLTSLGNRASYQETVHRLLKSTQRHPSEFGLLVLDLDKFKAVNDQHGHQEGDRVLVAVSQLLRHILRDTDYAFRFGGDEFCCLLPNSNAHICQTVAKRINQAMNNDVLLSRHGVSCSIGIATSRPRDTADVLFVRADSALYSAKESGRNCIKAA